MLNHDYLRDLTKLAELLTEREKQRFDDRHVDFLLVQAGELACSSLNHLLVEHDFWTWISAAENSPGADRTILAKFDDVVVPANAKLLKQLGYQGPPDAQGLLHDARCSIENAKHGRLPHKDVRKKIEDLAALVCGLAGQAKGILSAYPALPNKLDDPSSNLWIRIQKGFSVKKLIAVVKVTLLILGGVVSIAVGVQTLLEKPPEPPRHYEQGIPKVIPASAHDVDQFWLLYYQSGLDDHGPKDA